MTEPEMTDEDIRKTLNISNATNLMLLRAAAVKVIKAKKRHAWICNEGKSLYPASGWLLAQRDQLVEMLKAIDELTEVVGDPES